MVKQLQNKVSELAANNITVGTHIVGNGYTPMVKSIATPPTPTKDCHIGEINFNEVLKAIDTNEITIITAGIIRRPQQSPDTGAFSECGNGIESAPGIYNIGNGGGGHGGSDGDGPGDDDYIDRNGVIGTGYNNGNRKTDFAMVKSSNITITAFSGSSLPSNPYLPFYKVVKRLIYNQGEDGELVLDILVQVEKCGAAIFTKAQYKELVRQCPKATAFIRPSMPVLLNYTIGIAKGLV